VSDRKDEEYQELTAFRYLIKCRGLAEPVPFEMAAPVVRKQPLSQDGVEVALGSEVVDEAQRQDAGPVLLVSSFDFCIVIKSLKSQEKRRRPRGRLRLFKEKTQREGG
jgi:hypothetical protein